MRKRIFGTLNYIHMNFIQQLLIILWRRINFLNWLRTKAQCTPRQIKKNIASLKEI